MNAVCVWGSACATVNVVIGREIVGGEYYKLTGLLSLAVSCYRIARDESLCNLLDVCRLVKIAIAHGKDSIVVVVEKFFKKTVSSLCAYDICSYLLCTFETNKCFLL